MLQKYTRMVLAIAPMLFGVLCSSQSVRVEVAADTILDGNIFEVRYTFEDIEGDYEPPRFDDLELIGGPSTQSQTSIIGNDRQSRISYTYYLRAPRPGEYVIPRALMRSADGTFETDERTIVVIENPEEIMQDLRIADDQIQRYPFQYHPEEKRKKPAPPNNNRKRIKL